MAGPLVSVLIPCHNAERYVGEAIDSALAQTHPSVEVVVVDDGSTDRSADVVRRFGGRVVLEAGPNRGACAARNRALALSNGEYVQFLDADDLLVPTKIERQLPLLERGEADLVACGVERFGAAGPGKADRWPMPPPPEPGGDPFLYFLKHRVQTAAPLHRRMFVEKAGGFRVGMPRQQETDLHLRIAALSPRVAVINESLVRFREHDGARISDRPLTPKDRVSLYFHVADFVTRNGLLTPERAGRLARVLLWLVRLEHATPPRALNAEALRMVRRLDPTAFRDDPRPFRAARAVLGDRLGERFRTGVLRALGRVE